MSLLSVKFKDLTEFLKRASEEKSTLSGKPFQIGTTRQIEKSLRASIRTGCTVSL
jgi:hypothetical protein